jgi:hypothetical protein
MYINIKSQNYGETISFKTKYCNLFIQPYSFDHENRKFSIEVNGKIIGTYLLIRQGLDLEFDFENQSEVIIKPDADCKIVGRIELIVDP